MSPVSDPSRWIMTLGDTTLELNSTTLVMTWIAMGILLLAGFVVARRARVVPDNVQSVAEILTVFFRDLSVQSFVGDRLVRFRHPTFVIVYALFLFILGCNWLGVLPFMEEPTKDINTTMMLSLVSVGVAHIFAVMAKGPSGYVAAYFKPFIFMFPLNVLGEAAKVVSLSFRLFGNILGGSIIVLVVSDLIGPLLVEPLLKLFFSIFVGAIQAFVFAMLTLTYISLAVDD